MPYMYQRWIGDAARREGSDTSLLGASLAPRTLKRLERLELICSLCSDPGPDWSEWVAYDRQGQVIERRRVNGY